MQLYDAPASPFCRKVRILAEEHGLADKIELIASGGSPISTENLPTGRNPLGKIPTLVTDDGETLYDSRVICRYLDETYEIGLYPSGNLFEVLKLEALADGIMDAAVMMVYESRCRDEEIRSKDWVEAQWEKVTRALDHLEKQGVSEGFDMGRIALAAALGYLDFRHDARSWRTGRPGLQHWFNEVSKRPSMVATVPS